jgi:methylaspartate ammonia-lyase
MNRHRDLQRRDDRFEGSMTAAVGDMFAFAATVGAVRAHRFEAACQACLLDDDVRDFLVAKDRDALAKNGRPAGIGRRARTMDTEIEFGAV